MKTRYLFIVITALLFNSCLVIHTGSVSSGPVIGTGTRYVAIAKGDAKSLFLFGFGKLKRNNLVLEAKEKMYRSRPLGPDEYYANFTTAITNKFILGAAHVTQVTVSADVLQANQSQSGFDENFKALIAPFVKGKKPQEVKKEKKQSSVSVGDSVYYSYNSRNYKLYKVMSADGDHVMLEAKDGDDKNRLVSSDENFFITGRQVAGYKSGDKVTAELLNVYNSPVQEDGFVIGGGDGLLLIKTKSGYYAVPPVKLRRIN